MSYVVPVKSKMEILQNVVAFPEYMNFKILAMPPVVTFVTQVCEKKVVIPWTAVARDQK